MNDSRVHGRTNRRLESLSEHDGNTLRRSKRRSERAPAQSCNSGTWIVSRGAAARDRRDSETVARRTYANEDGGGGVERRGTARTAAARFVKSLSLSRARDTCKYPGLNRARIRDFARGYVNPAR